MAKLSTRSKSKQIDIRRFTSAVSFAAKQWSQKDRYLKGRREYMHWEEANPHPEGISLVPNIDADEPKSPEKIRDDVCTRLARWLHAGNTMLEKCRSLMSVSKIEAEKWGKDVAELFRLIAGEVALAKFFDTSGIPPAPNLPFHDERFGFFLEGKAIFDFLYVRCYRLRQLIDEIESGKVMPLSHPYS